MDIADAERVSPAGTLRYAWRLRRACHINAYCELLVDPSFQYVKAGWIADA
ncbi:MAG: hypothetical protein KME64_33965 [Scytonematopsis contorta HA4267-MV1]|jgi:hypothetical protein|nr:hypothetical protein [Scytonematopsis contorta HA4267-MV1]